MSLDPMLANPTPMKLDNPLENYGNALRASYLQQEIAKAKEEQNQNVLVNQTYANKANWNPDSSFNFNKGGQDLAGRGGGVRVAPMMLDASKIADQAASANMNVQKGNDYQASAFGKTIKNFHDSIGGLPTDDPTKFLNLFAAESRQFNNNMGALHRSNPNMFSNYDPEAKFNQSIQEAQQAANGGTEGIRQFILAQQKDIGEAYKTSVAQVQQGDRVGLMSTNGVGSPPKMVGVLPVNQTPEQAAKLALEASKNYFGQANLGGSVVPLVGKEYGNPNLTSAGSLPTTMTPAQEGAPGTALTTDMAKTFLPMHMAARELPQAVKHLDTVLELVKDPQLIAGSGQPSRLLINKVYQLANMAPPADPSVVTTEVLNKMLSGVVLQQMQGAHNMRFSNLLLKNMQDANANGQMDPASITTVVKQMRDNAQNQNQIQNEMAHRLKSSGRLGSSMQDMGVGTLPVIADYGIPQAAVDDLIKNPTPVMQKHFDDAFHSPGMAARMVKQSGGTPNGGNPLTPGGQ